MGKPLKIETLFNERLIQHIKEKNNAEVLSILQNVDLRQLSCNDSGNSLLHYAAKYGNNEFVQHLIDLGAAVDARNRDRQTPLLLAVDFGHEDTALLLVEANADLFLRDICGRCPLIAAVHRDPRIATTLLDALSVESLKKSIRYVNGDKVIRLYCGLHQFIRLKRYEITRLFLENGISANTKIPEIRGTALHLAAEQLDLEHVKLLLEFNADVNAKGCSGQTPLARIRIRNDEEHDKALTIVKVLMDAGAVLIDRVSRKPMVEDLLSTGNKEIIRFLLRDQIDLQSEEKYRWSYLRALVLNRQPDVLAEVPNLQSFAKIHNSYDSTILHLAPEAGLVG